MRMRPQEEAWKEITQENRYSFVEIPITSRHLQIYTDPLSRPIYGIFTRPPPPHTFHPHSLTPTPTLTCTRNLSVNSAGASSRANTPAHSPAARRTDECGHPISSLIRCSATSSAGAWPMHTRGGCCGRGDQHENVRQRLTTNVRHKMIYRKCQTV
jgi:hypothetical protein